MIGSFGDVVFIASANTIRTFSEFTRSSAGRWAKHEILGQKPKSQRVGPGLDTISFTMWFDAAYGLNPRKELDQLVIMERDGIAASLTVGGKGVGVDLWVITSLEQSWEQIDGKGNLLFATAKLMLEEYMQ